MSNAQPEEELRAALERISDLAQIILAETNTLLLPSDDADTDPAARASDAGARSAAAGPAPDAGAEKAELEAFRDELRANRDFEPFDLWAMEGLVREAQQLRRKSEALGSGWSEAARGSLADGLQQAKNEAQELAVRIIERGLDVFLQRARERREYLRRHPEQLSPWDAKEIRDEGAELDRAWDETTQAQCSGRLQAIRREALAVADAIEEAAHLKNLEAALHRRICNVTSVHRILAEMQAAADFFGQQRTLTAELRQRIRQGQERAARHRAVKKLSEARVAEAAGRSRLSERLRREATALLAQDWEDFFPGETPPSVS